MVERGSEHSSLASESHSQNFGGIWVFMPQFPHCYPVTLAEHKSAGRQLPCRDWYGERELPLATPTASARCAL